MTAAVGRWVPSLALLVCWTGASASARAAAHSGEARRVVAVAAPPALTQALRVALSPWALEVDTVDIAIPPAEVAAAAGRAAEIAGERHAGVVLWVQIGADDGAAWLWIYDRDSGQLAQRPLPAGPPTTAEPAAAAALTAKTMIRSSVIAPAAERFGARPMWAPRFRLEAGTEVRPLDAGPTQERLVTQSVAFTWAITDRFTVGAGLGAGPGFAVDDNRLVARFGRTSVTALGRYRISGGPRWALEPSAWLGLHFTSLDGAVPGEIEPIAEARTNFSLGAAASAVLRLGGLELAAIAGIDVALRRQRYLLGGVPLLELPGVEPVFGLQLRVPIR